MDIARLRLRCSMIGVALLLMPAASWLLARGVSLLTRWEALYGWSWTPPVWQAVTVAVNALYILTPLVFLLRISHLPARRLLPLAVPRLDYLFPAVGVSFGASAVGNILSSMLMGLLAALGWQVRIPIPVFEGGPTAVFFTMLLAAVCPALLEELLFRGAILQLLRPWGNGLAVGMSAFLFALCHASFSQFIPALAMGLCLGCFAVRSGSLLPGMVFHFLYNAIVIGLYLSQRHWGQAAYGLLSLVFFGLCAAAAAISGGFLSRRFGPVFALPASGCPLSREERGWAIVTSPPLVCAAAAFLYLTISTLTQAGAAG